MIRITHYKYKCIGCAYCVEVAPSRWQMNQEDGKSDLIGATERNEVQTVIVDDTEYEENLEAAQVCPAKCIKVEKI